MQFVSELRITMRRLGYFLSLPEPPEPWHARSKPAAAGSNGPAPSAGGGKPGWRRSSDAAKRRSGDGGHGAANGHSVNGSATNGHAAAPEQQSAAAAAEGAPVVEVAGADFDWADRSWAQPAGAAAASQPGLAAAGSNGAEAAKGAEAELAAQVPSADASQAAQADAKVAIEAAPSSPKAAAGGSTGHSSGFQLKDLHFQVGKGQLVGIVGAVGSGERLCFFRFSCAVRLQDGFVGLAGEQVVGL